MTYDYDRDEADIEASRAPLLANDTHLGVETPGIFHVAELHWPENQVAGVSIPGLPGIVIGRNRTVAWGVTVLAADWLAAAFKRSKWVERVLNWSFAAIFTAFAATILTAQARH